jgi:hypothetical protein
MVSFDRFQSRFQICRKKKNNSLVMPVRPFVRMKYIYSRWTEFRKILFWDFSDKKNPRFVKIGQK